MNTFFTQLTNKEHNYANKVYIGNSCIPSLDLYICCGSILSLIQILFPLFQTHCHQITITKTKEIKFEPRITLNHNKSTDRDFGLR